MTTTIITGSKFTLQSATDYAIGNASDEGANGGVLIQVVNDNSFSGTITVKGQAHATTIAGVTAHVPIPYYSLYLNGSAGTGAKVTTSITTDSLIYVPLPACDVVLSVASSPSGSASVYWTPVIGSGAY